MGVFSKDSQKETKVKRNAFDGSFQNNLTMKMGYLYPCLCKEVIPGDSFRINSAFGLRFMPTAFPVQTKIRCDLHLFYVRSRNLWNYWENYYTGVGKHDSFPVLSNDEAKEQSKTGSLGDYLGLPSTIVGNQAPESQATPIFPQKNPVGTSFTRSLQVPNLEGTGNIVVDNENGLRYFIFADLKNLTTSSTLYTFDLSGEQALPAGPVIAGEATTVLPISNFSNVLLDHLSFTWMGPTKATDKWYTFLEPGYVSSTDPYSYTDGSFQPLINNFCFVDNKLLVKQSYMLAVQGYTRITLGVFSYQNMELSSQSISLPSDPSISTLTSSDLPLINLNVDNSYRVSEATSVITGQWPYEISALPFRAYEQIYNSFYRDDRNNPFLVNGEYDPNIFIPNSNGGIDSTQYRLHKRNWEQDFLTTALPSPQFGQAPLVGLSSSGVATFALDDGTQVSSQLETDESGDKVVAFSTTKDANVNRQLVNMATTGISINDLRGVNSLQRYLETKYRIGLRYRDQVKAHFGVEISREELDMPEFIGSFTQMVDVTQINQTSPTYLSSGDIKDALGSYAGQLSCVGGRDRGFQKYFDEPGYVIGLISVVPVPAYSQLLPKHFTKINEPLDFYSPEFGHLGFQPIRYREVCPLQAHLSGVSMDSTFGYQRAWYDYLSSQDEIHGQFRTSLNDFVLARSFNTIPSLNEDFLTVDPDSMNDIFTVNEVNGKPVDTILGQIHFDITMMRPIPRFGIPRLE